MTKEEFNEKWKERLEEGFYGLAISNKDVVLYLDHIFRSLARGYPNFSYSQIKVKFNSIRFYATGIPIEIIGVIENRIKEILDKKDIIWFSGSK